MSFAFVAIVRGRAEVWTVGMHVLGLRDIMVKRADADAGDFDIIEVIRYLSRGEKPVEDGHLFADLNGPRFQAFLEDCSKVPVGSPCTIPSECYGW